MTAKAGLELRIGKATTHRRSGGESEKAITLRRG
jgi:hypothetical protein